VLSSQTSRRKPRPQQVLSRIKLASAVELHPFRAGTLGQLPDEARAALRALGPAADAAFAGACAALVSASAPPATLPPAAARALQAAVVDCCRCGAPASALRAFLEDPGLAAPKAAALEAAFASGADAQRAQLAAAGLPPPRLVALSWRLDYVVATQEGGRVGAPVFRVRLTLEEGAGAAAREFGVDFVCSAQELEDLQARLHDALRAATLLGAPGAGAGAGAAR
jgi:hypothetical protein